MTHSNGKDVLQDVQAIPEEYWNLGGVYSKQSNIQLPPHSTYVLAIGLQPSSTPPHGCFFFLIATETWTMTEYVTEASAKTIWSSSSPVATEFLFVKKKDGMHHSCADYFGLNRPSVSATVLLPSNI